MRAVKIGPVTLDHAMHFEEWLKTTSVTAEAVKTVDGSTIVYEQESRDSSRNVTLLSKNSGWQTIETLQSLVSASSDTDITVDVLFNDATKIKCRFRHEIDGGALQFEELYEGANYYKGTIYLARISE